MTVEIAANGRVEAVSPLSDTEGDDLFVACESFEDRAVGATARLRDYHSALAVLVSFQSRTKSAIGERKRKKNMSTLVELLEPTRTTRDLRRIRVDAYNALDLTTALGRELESAAISLAGARVTVDITCFTKIQLLFFLAFVGRRIKGGTLRLLYTQPSYYGSLDHDLASGYEGLLVAPFRGATRAPRGDRLAVVALLGHEGLRTMHAWTEMEPELTILMKPVSVSDPELNTITMRQNEALIERALGGDPDVSMLECKTTAVVDAHKQYLSSIDLCRRAGMSNLGFIPMGPKPLVAAFALAAVTAQEDDLPIDIVYPVPHAYDPDYSVGIGDTSEFIWRPTDPLRP